MPEETKPAPTNAPRPLPAGAMVSPLVPGLTVLGAEGMVGAVCDPNDPDSCEVPADAPPSTPPASR